MEKRKLRIGFYPTTSCYGCQLNVLNIEDKLIDIFTEVEVVCFHMATSASKVDESVDVAFIEGSVVTEDDEELVKKVRQKAKYVVAMGTCACHGGVQSVDMPHFDMKDAIKEVYGDIEFDMKVMPPRPLDKVIDVDFYLPGCPIEKDEFLYFLASFIWSTWPEEKDYPVCQECRMKGNPCVVIEKGEPCLGPFTTAGCGARCPSLGLPCMGCRGPIREIQRVDAMAQMMEEKGISLQEAIKRMKVFGGHSEEIIKKFQSAIKGGEV